MPGPSVHRVRASAFLGLLAFACLSVDAAQTRPEYPDDRTWSQYITMRDGVRLAADVHLPKNLRQGDRMPAILHLSRYYRSIRLRHAWKPFYGFGGYAVTERDTRRAFVKAGYAWIDVDVRGSGASFGTARYPLQEEEVADSVDVIDWIVEQPWSSGSVGATGMSYNGALAMTIVATKHPALKAVAPRFSVWDPYEDLFRPGGLSAASLIKSWAELTKALDDGRVSDVFGWSAQGLTSGVSHVDKALLAPAMAEHAANTDLRELFQHWIYRDQVFPRLSPEPLDHFSPRGAVVTQLTVPVYAYAGWFDGALARSQIRQYLANRHPGSQLRIGPWFHGGQFNASPYAEGKGQFDHNRSLLEFFGRYLRPTDAAPPRNLPVQYYTMGAERWRGAPSWPPPGAVWRSMYLSSGNRLGDAVPTALEADDSYLVDATFESAAARWGLIVGTGHKQRRYGDQRKVTERLLAYTSAPIPAALEVTGHPRVELHMAANADDAGVFVYLEDVAPDGYARYVTEGQLRLLHRALAPAQSAALTPPRSYDKADAKPLVPGVVESIVFDLLPTSYVFPAGHRLRIALSGADAATFDAPAPPGPLEFRVHRDRLHASRIELPTYPISPH